jgi:hypothetical protein
MASFPSIFGFEFKRKKDEDKSNNESFAPLIQDDGAVVVSAGGAYGTYVDMEGSARTEAELVTKYREMSLHAELDSAIEDIVNEAIIVDDDFDVIEINLDRTGLSDKLKGAIRQEFTQILQLFEFNIHSYDIFRRWYIDGRLYYHVIIDDARPQDGIKEFRYIDPRKIRKIREVKKKPIPNSNVVVTKNQQEYFIYNEKGFSQNIGPTSTGTGSTGVKISADAILHITSGLTDKNNQLVLGFLHTAIKPLNQLRTLEDATLIYRISRAPERRVFYIDVGNLPKMKAEQYLRDIMARFKNRVVYDSATGEVRDDRKFMTMLEDFWLPRREGGKGTEIQTLPPGQNLGQLEDVKYFQRNLYKALKIPVNRIEPEQTYNLGRATEITRDEVKFAKFVNRLQTRFATLFLSALEKQLILKKIITPEDWVVLSNLISFDFATDNHYAELKELEIVNNRMAAVQAVDPFVGKYFSVEWVQKNLLRQKDEDIEEIMQQIGDEVKQGIIQPIEQPEQAPPPAKPSKK